MKNETLKTALSNEIEKLEEKIENGETEIYTTNEVLALLYAIRDNE